ncbi:hypothetical protein GGX14DRAFT_626799 [Mycena pura]|uniref:Extracellular membrane protein CFEM domain-containing protein n=1 Tax=Mycena pura TaxID=153505 RepID=A0AAD6YQN9_9AGAR|nr:hypothetical protein GGX14DRAFT_626799 [Mycena pura]
MLASSLLLAVWVALLGTAIQTGCASVAARLLGGSVLRARQSSAFDPSQIPASCNGSCNSVVGDANTCTTLECLCSPAKDAAVLACVDCVIKFNHSSAVIVDGQNILNQFTSQCGFNNLTVSSLSASGVGTVTGLTTTSIVPPNTTVTSDSQTAVTPPPASAPAAVSATSPSLPISSTSASSPPSVSPSPGSTGAATVDGLSVVSMLTIMVALTTLMG